LQDQLTPAIDNSLNANAAGLSRQRCATWIRCGELLSPVASEWMSATIETLRVIAIKLN
jgi:hypothetical protein